MKRFNKIFLTSATLIGLAIGCKDDSLSPYIEPNGGASGLGQFVSLLMELPCCQQQRHFIVSLLWML
jgi:hypothetical protein